MGGQNEVKLYGMWACVFSKKVEIALKVKDIPYGHVEEDLTNKSQAILDGNPVYKKIPVLFHNGRPLVESAIILEYIDETWPNHGPRLLPQDPYERACVRFWSGFISQLVESVLKVLKCEGDLKENALNDLHEKMTLMEQEMKDLFPKNFSAIDSGNLGLLDIHLNSVFGGHKAADEVSGRKILDPEKHPRIFSWVTSLLELPVIKQTAPPHDMLVAFLRMYVKASP